MAIPTNGMSQALFNYMCKHIVGTEKSVKMKRMMNTVKDLSSYRRCLPQILSGSLGEGLEMKGSDRDYMYVDLKMPVFEDKTEIQFDPAYTQSVYVMEDTKGVFTKLRLIHTYAPEDIELCREVDGVLYLSSELYKMFQKSNPMNLLNIGSISYYLEVVHGPCLSDFHEGMDNAYCLHCKSWISPAYQWITRHRGMWHDVDVMSNIIDHGVLFVPVGCKGLPNEDIGWRISFSVGEKLLIYSFTHTQLVCYALMKILLKDVINQDKRCENLLCSYFIKTIIFWVSEELPVSLWRPENLIPCFMQCMKRLLYCVKYTKCPHFFIQDHNLFESKIEGERRKHLHENLNILISLEWRCIFLSEQLQKFHTENNVLSYNSLSFADSVEDTLSSWILNNSLAVEMIALEKSFKRLLQKITLLDSSRLKLIFMFCYSLANTHRAQFWYPAKDGNKSIYKQYKTSLCCIVQGLYRDSVSGWLLLASLFFKMKQYNIAISVLSHVLKKCSAEKVLVGCRLSKFLSVKLHQILKFNCWEEMGVLRTCTKLGLNEISLLYDGSLIPNELFERIGIHGHYMHVPPVVYAHFLCFLCHYHRKDVSQCYDSIRNLKVSITVNYFIGKHIECKLISILIYHIALVLVGEKEAAERVLHDAELIGNQVCSCGKKIRIE